jgi:hypothetical protein
VQILCRWANFVRSPDCRCVQLEIRGQRLCSVFGVVWHSMVDYVITWLSHIRLYICNSSPINLTWQVSPQSPRNLGEKKNCVATGWPKMVLIALCGRCGICSAHSASGPINVWAAQLGRARRCSTMSSSVAPILALILYFLL